MSFDLRQALQDMKQREPMDPRILLPQVHTRRLRFDPPFVVSIQTQGSDNPEKKGIFLATRWDGNQRFLVATDIYIGIALYNRKLERLRLHSCIPTTDPDDANTLEGKLSFYGFKDFDQWTRYDHRPMNV